MPYMAGGWPVPGIDRIEIEKLRERMERKSFGHTLFSFMFIETFKYMYTICIFIPVLFIHDNLHNQRERMKLSELKYKVCIYYYHDAIFFSHVMSLN